MNLGADSRLWNPPVKPIRMNNTDVVPIRLWFGSNAPLFDSATSRGTFRGAGTLSEIALAWQFGRPVAVMST